MHHTRMSRCFSDWGQILVLHPHCAGVWDLQLSAVGWEHPSSHKAVVAFSKETQWAGHRLEHLHEEEAAYGPMDQSRPMGSVGNGPWEATGSWWGDLCASCLAVSAALAVGEMHWAELLPWALVHWVPSGLPFPSPRWSLRQHARVWCCSLGFLFSFSEVLLIKFISEGFLLCTLFFNSLCQKLVCGKENFLFCLMLSCWVLCSLCHGRGA